MKTKVSSLLAGDIGATKTTLALYDTSVYPGPLLKQQTFQNSQFPSFDDLLDEYFDQGSRITTFACFGIAGPIIANTVKMTNLNWSIDAKVLQAQHGFQQVFLINDLVATALGAMHLPSSDLLPLNPGRAKIGGVKAVLAPGTGLGEAFLIPHNGVYHAYPSEGGHASFAPRNAEQMDLLAFMLQRHAHVSVEQVCSGLAIPELFAFMATREAAPAWLLKEIEQASDRTPVIVQAALQAMRGERSCDIAVDTLMLFADILADETANFALKTLAIGGLFLGGGLTPRLLPFLKPERFMPVFTRGVYQEMLARIPIHIIGNPSAALFGAAAYGALAMNGNLESNLAVETGSGQ